MQEKLKQFRKKSFSIGTLISIVLFSFFAVLLIYSFIKSIITGGDYVGDGIVLIFGGVFVGAFLYLSVSKVYEGFTIEKNLRLVVGQVVEMDTRHVKGGTIHYVTILVDWIYRLNDSKENFDVDDTLNKSSDEYEFTVRGKDYDMISLEDRVKCIYGKYSLNVYEIEKIQRKRNKKWIKEDSKNINLK